MIKFITEAPTVGLAVACSPGTKRREKEVYARIRSTELVPHVHAKCQKTTLQITQTVALVCKVFPQGDNVIVGIARLGNFFPEIQ
jgi:hypothetical protein